MHAPAVTDDGLAAEPSYLMPCVRHIASIQIRNLSPFPARDTLASALTQRPIGASGSGQASDDADILLGRRRNRRISSTSVNALKGIHSDQEHESTAPLDAVPRLRNRAGSTARVPGIASSLTNKRQPHVVSGSPTVRQRTRTTSHSSVLDVAASSPLPKIQASVPISGSFWPTVASNSQKELEDVIWSRLVETFLSINFPEGDAFAPLPYSSSPPEGELASKKGTVSRRLNGSVDLQRTNVSSPSPGSSGTRHSRQAASTSTLPASKSRSRVSPSVSNVDTSNVNASPSPSPRKTAFPNSPPLTPPSTASPVPVFISPLHRPSTNPKFELDSEDSAFAKWADLSSSRAIVRLWGHVGTEWGHTGGDRKGKGKEKETMAMDNDLDGREEKEWRILSAWDIRLVDLVPLPDDLVEQPWKLPANTLVITLSNSERAYYLPSTLIGLTPAPSRSHSPDYNSDTDIPRRRADFMEPRGIERGRQRKTRKELKSTNLNELVKLVSLQASLFDARNLLDEVVLSCDQLIEADRSSVLRREASEQEYRLQCLQEQQEALDDDVKSVRDGIALRKEQLRQRRIGLAEARALHENDLLMELDVGVRLANEKKRVKSLGKQIEPVRTSLLSTLVFIFPIELLSPPDLLYTILSVPLPIPLQGSDPAPPLSLSHFAEVNEDSVATALGYAALVVHLMAAYLCRGLVYPITYVGSRSLIKDPISAMMGPRMFPLYSKSVDTYRFEYAVFLLNKDIEMLMADRNLRSLDLRHTLPNLKNLLLTLTSGESALPKSRILPSPSVVSITSGLQSPSPLPAEAPEPPPLSLDDTSTTPKFSHVALPADDSGSAESTGDPSTQSSSSAIVPSSITGSESTSSASRPRLPRIQIQSYLGLAPLTSMWRSRYPSTSSVGKSEDEASPIAVPTAAISDASDSPTKNEESDGGDDESSVEGGDDEEDEDDRRTVRGSSVPTTPVGEVRTDGSFGVAVFDNLKEQICGTNGHALKALRDEEVDSEKHRDIAPVRTPPLAQ